MWYFSSPFIVFGDDALSHLRQIHGSRAFIVTDATLHRLGLTARIEQLLHDAGLETYIFSEVEPEPSLQTVQRGAKLAADFQPDWFVGLGGGSPLDAAKAIWALYERPDLDPTDINPLDTLGLHKAKLIAIPTTSGTGSEATWALVLTDTAEKRKFSTGSRELVPTFAIIDPTMTAQLPPRITADTGLDALTHAIEGYVCTWRNDFSDGLCLKAAQLVLEYLPRAVAAGADDIEAREKMGIAATLAGLGFGNSNLGLAHAMGHSFGAIFKVPHGRSVALFLPYTIEYTVNGGAGRYGEIARFVGLTDSHDEETGGRLLLETVRNLQTTVNQPMNIAALGISEADFRAALPTLCLHAEQDTQFFTAPRLPDSEELAQMFECAYSGEAIAF
jgi:alcohol dehydrogenase class IV